MQTLSALVHKSTAHSSHGKMTSMNSTKHFSAAEAKSFAKIKWRTTAANFDSPSSSTQPSFAPILFSSSPSLSHLQPSTSSPNRVAQRDTPFATDAFAPTAPGAGAEAGAKPMAASSEVVCQEHDSAKNRVPPVSQGAEEVVVPVEPDGSAECMTLSVRQHESLQQQDGSSHLTHLLAHFLHSVMSFNKPDGENKIKCNVCPLSARTLFSRAYLQIVKV
jgi:hypothetical protein